jgi:tRNA nucleotidyltransferase/poly(A) polymerase
MIFTKYTKFLEALRNENDMWNVIPQSVKDLHDLFSEQGKKLYLVGGSVRDFLTGDKPKDFDLATDALPDEVLEIIGDKYRTNLQGKAFGVVVVYTKDQPGGMEVATFREDISKGRNPEVKLGVTIEQDVKRRDLTYNALFYDLDKREIVDLTGGREDLEKGITRMVGDAIERFDEDSLRILRAFRFASRYQHPLDKTTEEAILKRPQLENIDPETGEMKRISQERVFEEMIKAWKQAKSYTYYLQLFNKFNMWDEVFPGSKINTEIKDCKFLITYIANLFYLEAWSNDLENRMVQNYKIDADTAKKAIFLTRLEELDETNAFDYYKSKVRCHITDEEILDWLNVRQIDSPIFKKFLKYKPSVSAEDLMKQGFKGKALGDEIKRLEIEKFKQLYND